MNPFPVPIPLKDALGKRLVKAILPTTLDSEMLRTLPRAVRERAMFSSGVQNTDFLTRAAESINKIVSGQSNPAKERTMLRELAESMGEDALAKDARLNLILDMQAGFSGGYGQWMEGQHPSVLDMWPCSEFLRIEERKEPRDWPQRWEEAGGEFYPGDSDYEQGRMIALKNDPEDPGFWERLSAFGLPYPPFDYQSGMGLADVDHDEAVELGIIPDDYLPTPQRMGLNDGLKAVLGPLAGKFGLGVAIGDILGHLGVLGEDGILHFTGK